MLKVARSSYYQSAGQVLPVDDIRVSVVELERLLHAMERQEENGLDETWHALQFKVNRCFTLWQNIESCWNDDNTSAPNFSPERFEYLRKRVVDVSNKFTVLIAEQKERDKGDDLIHRVFIARSLRQASSMDLERGSSSPDSSVASSEMDSVDPVEDRYVDKPITRKPKQPQEVAVAPNVEELQRMQREQVEEAISHMASQLKAETARINETLVGQTKGLDGLEDAATENIKQVSDVAKDVEDHVRTSWNRNIGTWTFFLTMVGVFFFVLVIIQMAPKGKGCVFFCPAQPRPDEFCRTLPNVRMECIRMEDEPPVEKESKLSQEIDSSPTPEDKHHMRAHREACEMNEYGECLPTHEDRPVTESIGREDRPMTRKEEQKITASVLEDTMFGSSSMIEDTTISEGKRPIFDRKHFSPRDIRNAANLGDYYQMEGYLTIKPEWVNKVDKNGWAAIHLSARRGDLRAIHFLKRIGADFSLKTVDGRTPRDIAVLIYEEGHPVVEALAV